MSQDEQELSPAERVALLGRHLETLRSLAPGTGQKATLNRISAAMGDLLAHGPRPKDDPATRSEMEAIEEEIDRIAEALRAVGPRGFRDYLENGPPRVRLDHIPRHVLESRRAQGVLPQAG